MENALCVDGVRLKIGITYKENQSGSKAKRVYLMGLMCITLYLLRMVEPMILKTLLDYAVTVTI
jgi:hypothetical protein